MVPNRILRDGIITSELINSLSWPAEVFYRRLHSVVDDYGRFPAHPSLLRAACYPLRLNDVSDRDVEKWLAECADKALVKVYEVEGKRYLEVARFSQRVRADKSKCPDPPAYDCQVTVISQATAPVVEGVVDVDLKALSGNPDAINGFKADSLEILDYLNRNAGRAYRPVDTNLKLIAARLKSGATPLQCREVIFNKCQQWKADPKMAEYLRPATLFNATKFEQYLGELNG